MKKGQWSIKKHSCVEWREETASTGAGCADGVDVKWEEEDNIKRDYFQL